MIARSRGRPTSEAAWGCPMYSERVYKTDRREIHVTDQTILDLATRYKTAPVPKANKHLLGECTPTPKSAEWRGGLKSTAQLDALMMEGWREGGVKLSELASALTADIPASKSRRRRARWADDGDDLDVDKALAGDWDTAYRVCKREITSGSSTLELIVPWGGNCFATVDELFWGGAVAVVLTDILENAGYSVRLVSVCVDLVHCGGLQVSRVVVKEAGEALRLDESASALCHAGVFRTLGFKQVISAPWPVDTGLGSIQSLGTFASELTAINEYPDDKTGIVLPQIYDRSKALTTIKDVLTKITGGQT